MREFRGRENLRNSPYDKLALSKVLSGLRLPGSQVLWWRKLGNGENDQFEGSTPSSSSWSVPQGPKGYRSFRGGNAFLGIDGEGYREVLGFWTSGSDAESALSWREILFSLKERGLTEPLLVVGDGLRDLREAVKEVYPEAQFQSDLVHKTRNVLRKVRKRDERAVLEDLKKMYAASSLEEFQEHFETFKKNWKHLYPEGVFPGEGFALSHHSPWVPYSLKATHPHRNSLSVASRG